MLNAQYIRVDTVQADWVNVLPQLRYTTGYSIPNSVPYIHSQSVTSHNYNNPHQLVLLLTNGGKAALSYDFYCGHWVNYKAYAVSKGVVRTLQVNQVFNDAIGSYVPLLNITLQPQDSLQLIIVPDIRKFNYGYINPFLIKKGYINAFGFAYYINGQKIYVSITFIFIGVLIVIFLYAFISWRREQSSDFIYYAWYILSFILYFLLRVFSLFVTDYNLLNHNLYSTHVLLNSGYLFYMLFTISFLQVKVKHPTLYKALLYFLYLIIAYLVLDAVLIYCTTYAQLSIVLFLIMRYVLLLCCVIVAVILLRYKDKLANFIAVGILFLFAFGLVSLLYSTVSITKGTYFNFFDMRITWYQIGIFFELLAFTLGLQYKTNMRNKQIIVYTEQLKIENEKKELETYKRVLEGKDLERVRIAQEIHDDIGSGLTSIRLLSEIAKQKYAHFPLIEIDKISNNASELIENMNEIIWSINSKNDYLANLIAYIRSYVVTYFEAIEHIEVTTQVPLHIPDVALSGEYRRGIFLVIKESLHNIIKHAKASQVKLIVQCTNTALNITIIDDGKGINTESINPFSNGLKNMKERIEKMNGVIHITNAHGTTVSFTIPLHILTTT